MQTINIHAAKTHFSRLVEQAAAGEEIIIAKAGKPICRLVPLAPERKERRKLGIAAGEWVVPDDFDAPLPDDVLDAFDTNPLFPPGEEPLAESTEKDAHTA